MKKSQPGNQFPIPVLPVHNADHHQNTRENKAQVKCTKDNVSIMILNIYRAMPEQNANHQENRNDGEDDFVGCGKGHGG